MIIIGETYSLLGDFWILFIGFKLSIRKNDTTMDMLALKIYTTYYLMGHFKHNTLLLQYFLKRIKSNRFWYINKEEI